MGIYLLIPLHRLTIIVVIYEIEFYSIFEFDKIIRYTRIFCIIQIKYIPTLRGFSIIIF